MLVLKEWSLRFLYWLIFKPSEEQNALSDVFGGELNVEVCSEWHETPFYKGKLINFAAPKL